MKRRLPLIVTATLIAALLCVALCSCARRDTLYDLSYDSSAYTAKESVEAEGIASLDIEWFAGEVRFERTEDAKLGASERGAGKRGELYTMHTKAENGTLYIKCAAPGKYELIGDMVKTLTVRVPEDLSFDSVSVNGYSVNVYAQGLASKLTRVKTSSGAIVMDTEAKDMTSYPRDISLETSSGDIWLNVLHPVVSEGQGDGKVEATTSSGQLDVKVNAPIPLLKVKTSSGAQNIELEKEVSELDITTSSGKVDVALNVSPLKMNVWAEKSSIALGLNGNDAFELISDAKVEGDLTDSFVREPLTDGNFKYTYRPDGYLGAALARFTVQGKNSVLRLKKRTS